MGDDRADEHAKDRSGDDIREKMGGSKQAAHGHGKRPENHQPADLWEPDSQNRRDGEGRHGMPGGKRIPSSPSEGKKFGIARVHEFRARPSDEMLQGGIDSACHQMGNECFPPGALEAGTPKHITRREEYDQCGNR
jgi:hypothetical protein